MKDSVVRGCLARLLYQRQSEGFTPFGQAEHAVPPPVGINRRDWLRAVAQRSEYRLIDWTPLEDKSGMGLLSGFAKIDDLGVKVLEAGFELPSGVSVDRTQRTKVTWQQQTPIAAITPSYHHSRIPGGVPVDRGRRASISSRVTDCRADRPGMGRSLDQRPEDQRQCHPGSFSNIGNSAGDHRSLALPQVSLLASTARLRPVCYFRAPLPSASR